MYTESLRAFLKPVLPYLDDDAVTEIMINGPEDVWIEKKGKLYKTDARFSEEGLLGAARNMAQFVGRVLSDERPRLDARLPDGSRIHVVLPPIARKGATIAIRKFFKEKLRMDALLKFGSVTEPMARLIEAAVRIKLNIIVSGGTGSGKTTLLNIISSLIPNEERILTIEDSAELQLNQEHLVAFESRPPDKFGKGEVNMGDLLHSALRLRPDRIVVGEVRGGECFHLMQAMNTGHGGSLATCHANTPTDTLRRLESLCLMSSVELPMVAVRAQVASAINLIICCERLHDGSRKVTHISEVLPLNEKGEYRTQDLFVFTPVTKDEEGNVLGYHAPTGIIPTFVGKARAYGFTDLDDRFFDPATYGLPVPPLFNVGEDYTIRWVPSLKHREKGLPDPDGLKEQYHAFEQKLKAQARERAQSPRTERASAPPQQMQRALTRPAPRPGPEPKQAFIDDDKTPTPMRNPLHRPELGDSPADSIPDATTGAELLPDEPKVEVAEELLSEAAVHATELRSGPPRASKPSGRPATGQNAAARTTTPAPKRPVRQADVETGEEEGQSDDKTRIKPMPERFRR